VGKFTAQQAPACPEKRRFSRAVKNTRALYLLFAANAISGASQGILLIAIPWYFISLLGRPGLFGVLYMALNIASLFWGLYAGALVDRYDRRRIFLVASLCGAAVSGGMALLGFATGQVPLWGAAAAFSTTILIFNIHYPNLYAFGQEITAPEDYGRITSYLEIQGQLTNALAGALGAVLLSGASAGAEGLPWIGRVEVRPWSLQQVLLLDACTYLLAWFLLLRMRYERVARRQVQTGSVWLRLRSGLDWLREHPRVFVFGTASHAIFATVLVTGFYLQAVYVEYRLEAEVAVFAWSEVAFSLGSVSAGLLILRVLGRMRAARAIALLSLVAASYYLLGAVNYWLPLFYLSFLLLGTSNAGARILRVTWLFRHVPNDTIGRVNGVFNSINVLVRIALIGLFSLPFFAGGGVTRAFVILALLILCGAGVLLWNDRETPAG
jgi:DHA3 family macrolide efflux protein-like MFS transporter